MTSRHSQLLGSSLKKDLDVLVVIGGGCRMAGIACMSETCLSSSSVESRDLPCAGESFRDSGLDQR
jgi:hypothetical protein